MTRRLLWFLGVGALGLVIGAKGMEWYIANRRGCATSVISKDGQVLCSCHQYSGYPRYWMTWVEDVKR